MPRIIYKNDNGKRLRSVTTILSSELGWNKMPLIAWYTKLAMSGQDPYVELQTAGRIGTLTHEMVEAHILSNAFGYHEKKIDLDKFSTSEKAQARIAYKSYCNWYDNCLVNGKKSIKFLETEVSLVSEKYQFGGTFDAIAEINGKNYLIDFKTSKSIYQEYVIQLAAYRQLWQEHSDLKIHGGIILKLSKDEVAFEEKKVLIKDLNKGWSLFKMLLKIQSKKEKYGGK